MEIKTLICISRSFILYLCKIGERHMAGTRISGINLRGGSKLGEFCRMCGREIVAVGDYPEKQRCPFCNALFTDNPNKHIR